MEKDIITNDEAIEDREPSPPQKKKKSNIKRIWEFLKFSPLYFKILLGVSVICLLIHIISNFSPDFADFMVQYPNAAVRFCLAKITDLLPFSLAEVIIMLIPALLITMVAVGLHAAASPSGDKYRRYIAALMSVIFVLYSLFVLTLAPGYKGRSLAEKTGLEQRAVSAEELYETSMWLNDMIGTCIDDVTFDENGDSVMPFSMDELCDKINDAYASLSEKYSFVSNLRSRIKYVILSEPMTYTHISGVYTYYTGESNLNVNFQDYMLVYTMAHEFSHQRGIAPENEANFVAFLACMESDDPYILYSGCLSMLDYCMSALYSADKTMYNEFYGNLDRRVIGEFTYYSSFYQKYADNVVANVSGAVNDSYLKSQGQSAGSKSYGLVVDLAVAYHLQNSEN